MKLTAPRIATTLLAELDRIHDPFGPVSGITIRQLLDHSSGLRERTWPWRTQSWQPHEPTQWQKISTIVPYTEVEFAPGSRFGYSNVGYVILGRIVELVTGDDIEVYLDKNVLKPLGMYHSYFDKSPWHLRSQRTNSYLLEKGALKEVGREFDTGITVANGGLNAPMTDMAKLASFLLRVSSAQTEPNDPVLRPATLARMLQPQLPIEKSNERSVMIGLGFFLVESHMADGESVRRYFGHTSYQLGNRSFLYLNDECHCAVLAAANTTDVEHGHPAEAELRRALRERVMPTLARSRSSRAQ